MSFVIFALLAVSSSAAEPVVMAGKEWSVTIDPSTLKITATLPSGETLPISSPTTANWHADQTTFTDPTGKTTATFTLENNTLIAHFTATDPGNLTWPTLTATDAPQAYLLPTFEGVRVPSDDVEWADFLEKQSPLDTTAGLSMPFWATQHASHTITYLAVNPFNNELALHRDAGKLTTAFTHKFTRNHKVKEYELRITLGGPSDVEPAKIYRQFLITRGEFVPFTQKIAKIPDAAKLPGAAHIYLWGDNILSRYDFIDAPALCKKILAGEGVSARLLSQLDKESLALLNEIAAKPAADNYDRGRLADALSPLIERPDLFTSEPHTPKQNALQIQAAFPTELKPVADWGDGFSPKMVHRLADAGLDRLWLGAPDWKGLGNHPDFVQAAIAQGYLVGPYDSFHSIHSPAEKDTWETAQFDQALYDTGGVITADGSPKKGFKQKGHILSPLAARPAVEARVHKLAEEFNCNSWFIDCDAFGEVFDDYSPAHPSTQEQDMRERLRRMAWIRDTFHFVVGSEGGSSYAASTLHFAHGIMTPVIGWGDPDLTDRKSPYFLGRYYPPDQPEMSFKRVPMKPLYRRIFADPRFRIPLYEVALHDSIITTHEWGEGSLKFTDPDHARELLELLYNVPPLYHLNTAQWQKDKPAILAHYQFFSPLHREAALLPMTDWKPLTTDRLVQRTTFGDSLEMIVNFSETPYTYDNTPIPKQSALAHWRTTNKSILYTPTPF